jgi:plastocyanin
MDPKRPWKFSRYYIEDAKRGFLAEAVVALDSPSLATGASEAPQSHTMDQINFQFVPETMAIRAGDSVRITNSDEALHNVMTLDGGNPFNVNVVKGKDFTRAFDHAGGLIEPIRLSCVFQGNAGLDLCVRSLLVQSYAAGRRFRFGKRAGGWARQVVHPAGTLGWNARIAVKPNQKRRWRSRFHPGTWLVRPPKISESQSQCL